MLHKLWGYCCAIPPSSYSPPLTPLISLFVFSVLLLEFNYIENLILRCMPVSRSPVDKFLSSSVLMLPMAIRTNLGPDIFFIVLLYFNE